MGTLAIGTSGYSVTALLPAMSTHLHISTVTAGQMFTVFAVTCALSGPAIAVATLRWERRRLLVAALTITGLGNALAAVASTVTMMIGARIITALGTAVYTAAAVAVAASINEPQRRARAMSVVLSGLTLALLFGVPTSNALSRSLGYQGVFWLIAALCALSATAIMVIVPTVAAPATASLSERLAAAKDRRVLVVLATALFACTSTFAVYTYVAVVLGRTPGAHGATTSALLAGYGGGAAIGNILGGRASDRYGPRRALLAAAATSTVLLLMLPITATTMAGAASTLVVWGFAFWSINPPLNSWLVQLAPTQANLLLPLLASSIYLGMGLGGLLGGLVVAQVGLSMLGPIAAVMSAAACAVLLTRPVIHHSQPRRGASAPRSGSRRGQGVILARRARVHDVTRIAGRRCRARPASRVESMGHNG